MRTVRREKNGQTRSWEIEEGIVTDNICRKLIAEARDYSEESISIEDIEEYFADNRLSVNVARNGNRYLWLMDGIDEAIYCIETGEMITGDEAAKFSEEQFA